MSWPIGTIEPLIPVPDKPSRPPPNNANDSAPQSTSLLDLISSSPLEPTSTPLFPARKPAPSPAPIRSPPPSSQNDLSPMSPGFGDFVSVPPSLDPLALSLAPTSPDFERTFGTDFVQGAKARTAEKERQVMDEFRQSQSENDPLGLLPEREPTPPDVDPIPSEATKPVSIRSSSDIKRAESEPSLPSLNESLPASPPPSDPSASVSTSASFSLGSRLTLPRAWTSLLSSSLPSLSPTMTVSKLDATPPTHPSELPPHPKPVRESSITHVNPFAHTFVPPSGAPGYTGERWDKGFTFGEEDKTASKGSRLKLVGRSEMTTPILNVETAEMLRPALPALRRLTQKWTLLYSLDQHGISLATFYARCAQPVTGGCLVAIRDAEGATFGVWCGDGVRKHEGYTGSGESFLWSQQQDRAPVKVFKWTGKNDYKREVWIVLGFCPFGWGIRWLSDL
ncbi:oxidation resistance protein 1 [Ceratobasidium sp. 392]|nr:oxidation resistance protein 1 [Ceratobasidium sp. 392]